MLKFISLYLITALLSACSSESPANADTEPKPVFTQPKHPKHIKAKPTPANSTEAPVAKDAAPLDDANPIAIDVPPQELVHAEPKFICTTAAMGGVIWQQFTFDTIPDLALAASARGELQYHENVGLGWEEKGTYSYSVKACPANAPATCRIIEVDIEGDSLSALQATDIVTAIRIDVRDLDKFPADKIAAKSNFRRKDHTEFNITAGWTAGGTCRLDAV